MSTKKKFTGVLAAVAMTVLASPAAYAATFNLGGPDANASSFGYSVDGIGLTVTGERKDDDCVFLLIGCSSYQSEEVSRDSNGLGVEGWFFDSSALDGQINERLTFSFDQDVKMMSLMFTEYDDNDPYDIYVDSGAGFSLISSNSYSNPYTFSPYLTGDTLRIGVTGDSSAFRVSSVTVSAVPLPAAGWLMIAGLGGLAAMRRRKKAA